MTDTEIVKHGDAEIEPGVYDDVPFEDYLKWDAVHKSNLWILNTDPPAKYRWICDNVRADTEALLIGHATHTAILEPDLFDSRYAVPEEKWDRRTKVGKAAAAEFEKTAAGKTVLTPDQLDQTLKIRDAIWNNPLTNKLLQDCVCERSIVWNDHHTGLRCKARIDAWRKNGLLIDLKTCRSCNPTFFPRDAYKFGYHFQASMYFDGAKSISKEPVKGFVLIAVEKTPPYLVAVYEVDEEVLSWGRNQYKFTLMTVKECLEKGEWPGHPPTRQLLELPSWAGTEVGTWNQ